MIERQREHHPTPVEIVAQRLFNPPLLFSLPPQMIATLPSWRRNLHHLFTMIGQGIFFGPKYLYIPQAIVADTVLIIDLPQLTNTITPCLNNLI
jgi:hypothetical protein